MLYIDYLQIICYHRCVEQKKLLPKRQISEYTMGRRRKNTLSDTGHSFISYFKRATSPLVVLHFLSEKPMYGYEISAELKSRSDGKYMISILYPVLYRLEEQGYIEISATEVAEGRARSYYSITSAGRDYLKKTEKEYLEISKTFEALMK